MRLLMLIIGITVCGMTSAGDLRIVPPAVTLQFPNATQQCLVLEDRNGRIVKDETEFSRFESSNPKVAVVDSLGVVKAVSEGTATISAFRNGKTATMTVSVESAVKNSQLSFDRHVIPTLTRAGCNSGACHGALAGKGGFKLSLRGFDPDADWFAMTRQAQARRTDTAQPAESLLLRKAIRDLPHGGGKRINQDSLFYTLLKDWIASGAEGPKTVLPVQSVEVYPPSILGSVKGKYRVIALAKYADGHTEDITKWAKFSSSEDQVASVDEDGVITVTGSGVAGVSVVYGTNVASTTVTVPFGGQVNESAFVLRDNPSLIDSQIMGKLKELNLPPSPPASDAEFVRRAFLDCCGILPTAQERSDFIQSQDPNKKQKLIDSLLAREEYVDYWSYRWSDLFLISTRELPQSATWSFYRSIRQAVAENMPWDQFARQFITATGSTLQNGSTNYFVLHKDTANLAETTALTFLGTSIGCAKCHNHPLEKWTQDQYWAFANLFSRVALKNGDAPGEVIVSSSMQGEALHPRRGVGIPPAPLGGTSLALDSANDRRKHFADWMTAKDNPFFAKAIVNRVWKAYMGRGVVEAEDDLRATNPASNPELFDALSKDLIANGYDLKRLMKMILNSAAYGRSSKPFAANTADDRFYSRYFVRRLPAEIILDAYSTVSGVPTPFVEASAGPSNGFVKKSDYPNGTRAVQLPDTLLVSRFLDQFGRPERLQACACERSGDSSVGQALHVSNGQTLNDKLRDEKSIVKTWLKSKLSPEEIVQLAFQTCLGRDPLPAEQKKYVEALKTAESTKEKQENIEDILWALLTGKEFLFNH